MFQMGCATGFDSKGFQKFVVTGPPRKCAACHQSRKKADFSNNQWAKQVGQSRCNTCVAIGQQQWQQQQQKPNMVCPAATAAGAPTVAHGAPQVAAANWNFAPAAPIPWASTVFSKSAAPAAAAPAAAAARPAWTFRTTPAAAATTSPVLGVPKQQQAGVWPTQPPAAAAAAGVWQQHPAFPTAPTTVAAPTKPAWTFRADPATATTASPVWGVAQQSHSAGVWPPTQAGGRFQPPFPPPPQQRQRPAFPAAPAAAPAAANPAWAVPAVPAAAASKPAWTFLAAPTAAAATKPTDAGGWAFPAAPAPAALAAAANPVWNFKPAPPTAKPATAPAAVKPVWTFPTAPATAPAAVKPAWTFPTAPATAPAAVKPVWTFPAAPAAAAKQQQAEPGVWPPQPQPQPQPVPLALQEPLENIRVIHDSPHGQMVGRFVVTDVYDSLPRVRSPPQGVDGSRSSHSPMLRRRLVPSRRTKPTPNPPIEAAETKSTVRHELIQQSGVKRLVIRPRAAVRRPTTPPEADTPSPTMSAFTAETNDLGDKTAQSDADDEGVSLIADHLAETDVDVSVKRLDFTVAEGYEMSCMCEDVEFKSAAEINALGLSQLMALRDLRVSNPGVGEVVWPGPVDVTDDLQLARAIKISPGVVVVTPSSTQKGHGLNREASVAFFNIKKSKARIEKAMAKMPPGCKMLSFKDGIWKFTVPGF